MFKVVKGTAGEVEVALTPAMLHSAPHRTRDDSTQSLGARNRKSFTQSRMRSSHVRQRTVCCFTMSADDTATSTRVFVSGLPPSFTSDDLRKHFSQKSPVNDAHVLAGRRIGFVGFPDHAAAQNAANYFNRSFIRMSKISVSLARPVEVNRDAGGQAAPIPRRRERTQKFEEPSGTRKRKRDLSDDERHQRERPQTFHTATHEVEDRAAVSPPVEPPSEQSDFEGFGSEGEEKASQGDEEDTTKPVSDSDWLRGKTNRTLDLQDPDAEPAESKAVQQLPSPISPGNSPAPPSPDEDADVREEKDTQPSLVDVPNGRLFVRNLAFSASEQDLESLFSEYGRLEEVRHILPSHLTLLL